MAKVCGLHAGCGVVTGGGVSQCSTNTSSQANVLRATYCHAPEDKARLDYTIHPPLPAQRPQLLLLAED